MSGGQDLHRPVRAIPRRVARGALWPAVFLALGGVAAGCGAGSSPVAGPAVGSTQPSASSSPAGLTGFGASKASWVAAHHGLNGGAFSGVKTGNSAGHPITAIHLRFAPVRQGIARFNAESQLPPDARATGTSPSGSCLRIHYTSQQLARGSGLGPDVYAYFSSGPRGFPYNVNRVNSVILSVSASGVAC